MICCIHRAVSTAVVCVPACGYIHAAAFLTKTISYKNNHTNCEQAEYQLTVLVLFRVKA